ncbi:ABC transporter permease [Kitasatospora sp. NPDC049258]|uniref:ABC transporter permease n=1 Tax=Kitasatospora sp. NPDC049258 TaxID=3155394 RepID=UPI00342BA8E3
MTDETTTAELRKDVPAQRGSDASAEPAVKVVREWQEIWHRFAANRLALVGLVLVAGLLFTAAFAPWIAPYDPLKQNLMNTLQPPTGEHLFGTDILGRDQLSRVIYGARIAVFVGLVSIILTLLIGIVLGAVAGYFGRFYDTLVMRTADVFFAFPLLIGSIIIITVTGRGVWPVVLSLAIFGWATVARLLRSSVLSAREMDYVHAARALGAGHLRVITRHILPNSIAPVIIFGTFNVGLAVVAEAALSYLGVGVSPEVPEWGNMLASGRGFIGVYDYMWTLPSLAVVLTSLGFIFVGDGVRDALDPKLR